MRLKRGSLGFISSAISTGVGTFENGTTHFVNTAYLNERYKPLEPAGKIRIVDL
jgi:hypothetical protein